METKAKKKPYYEIDNKKKVITLDMNVTPSADEEKFVGILIASGAYDVRKKSAEKAKQMKERAKKLPSKQDIRKALADDAANLAKFEAICKMKDATESYNGSNGFFAARSWYMNEVANKETKKK